MSVVTSVILTTFLDETKAMKFIAEKWYGPGAEILPATSNLALCYGPKVLQMDVYLFAFNFIDPAKVIAAIQDAPWFRPKSVQLFVSGESQHEFSTVNIWGVDADKFMAIISGVGMEIRMRRCNECGDPIAESGLRVHADRRICTAAVERKRVEFVEKTERWDRLRASGLAKLTDEEIQALEIKR